MAITVSSVVNSFGQSGDKRMDDKIEAKRIGHLTNELDLKPEEAKEFWPLYNALKSDLKANKKKARQLIKNSTDADIVLREQMKIEEEQLAIRHRYVQKIKALIGAERTLSFLKAERGFNAQMLKGLRGKRAQKRKNSGF